LFVDVVFFDALLFELVADVLFVLLAAIAMPAVELINNALASKLTNIFL
jgi:hypothetical protein